MVNFANLQARQLLDGGLTGDFDTGKIELRDGTIPSSADDAATGTVLALITMDPSAFGNATDESPGALATANAIASTTGLDAGTVTWARAYRTDGTTTICDMEINVDFTMTNPVIAFSSPIDTDSFTIFQPESP